PHDRTGINPPGNQKEAIGSPGPLPSVGRRIAGQASGPAGDPEGEQEGELHARKTPERLLNQDGDRSAQLLHSLTVKKQRDAVLESGEQQDRNHQRRDPAPQAPDGGRSLSITLDV